MELEKMEPDIRHARRTAVTAHNVVIKLKEMGLPDDLDRELALMSVDLGDLWSAQKELADLLEKLIDSPMDWGEVGDSLVDIRATIDHVRWHADSVRRPMTRLTHYAHRQADQPRSGR